MCCGAGVEGKAPASVCEVNIQSVLRIMFIGVERERDTCELYILYIVCVLLFGRGGGGCKSLVYRGRLDHGRVLFFFGWGAVWCEWGVRGSFVFVWEG